MRTQRLWAFAPFATAFVVLVLCLSAVISVSADEISQEVCTHTNTTTVNALSATNKSNGYTGDTQCTDCGAVISYGTEIAKIETVSLSKTSYVYNGKAKTPKVTVTDSLGNKIDSSQYTVAYKNNKKVGKATVTVKFASSNYNATVTKTFKIKPASVKLTKVTGVSKGFTAKWSTVSAQADGYQIQCATNSSFTKGKVSKKISGKKTATGSVTSVKAERKYYVRVRSYKTVNGVTYYSKWSNAKTVTTKKRITVFAGDSLATGLYPSAYNGVKYFDISGTEKVVAYKGLNTLTYQTLGKFSGGKSGLEAVISYKPYRVYFMLGINEIEWKSVSSTIENYSEIIEEVQEESPATDIVILSVSPVSRSVAASRKGFRKISTLNAELKKMAEKYGVSYYDYSTAFKDSSGYQLSKYNGGDGIHWNLNGYKKFAEIISKYDASKEKKGK